MTTIEAGRPPAESAAEARQARLAASVARIRRPSGFDVERSMHWAGSILFPTGIIVILLGWYGASHTSYGFEQIPYLISGGILGTALTIVGGFLYFGYWISRLVQESRRERTELAELLTRLDNRMATLEAVATGTLPGATAAAAPTARTGASSAPTPSAPVPALVATATGSLVHRPDCPLVADKAGLRRVDPATPGLKPCKVCDPFDGEPPPTGGPASAEANGLGETTTRRARPLRA